MASGGATWVDVQERVLDIALDAAQRVFGVMLDQAGERQFGTTAAEPLHQLADYLTWGLSPDGWAQKLGAYQQQAGCDRWTAEAWMVREETRLQHLLLDQGGWDGSPEDVARAAREGVQTVQQRIAAEAGARAIRDVDRLHRLQAMPKAILTPAVPVPDIAALIQQAGAEPAPPPAESPLGPSTIAGPLQGPPPDPYELGYIARYSPEGGRQRDLPAPPSMLPV